MKNSKVWWIITAALVIFIFSIIISAELNKEIIDYTGYEQGTIVQTNNGIRVDGCWYDFDEWTLSWENNNPVLTRKGTHSFLGTAELWVGILVGLIALGTGTYAFILHDKEKDS